MASIAKRNSKPSHNSPLWGVADNRGGHFCPYQAFKDQSATVLLRQIQKGPDKWKRADAKRKWFEVEVHLVEFNWLLTWREVVQGLTSSAN